ncbi:FAD-dependent oxidoreductase [Enterovirga sp. DB1703]|uniref:Tryptophan 2-monooxygenase n=1 Tax=Enterovirga aerilata TaxID=2730920 RepID=A0A849I259_9HYPH|nr:FAD-dependent oxidoreductase [Enterovirga sp. DB1703]
MTLRSVTSERSVHRPISTPSLAEPEGEVDVAIVGAGAAGIAAARFCRAAGASTAVLEARDRVGGRAVTVRLGGHAVDLGAHWLHAGGLNPLVRLGRERGEAIRRAPGQGHVVLDGRFGTRADREAHGRGFEAADRAFAAAARRDGDVSLAQALPPLGRWRAPIAATMALISGRPLAEVSAQDFPSDEFGDNYFIRGGYGAFLARLAAGLPVRLGCPVTAIDWSGPGVRLSTPRGTVRARAAVVTVPMPLLAGGAIRFAPGLPPGMAEALSGFLPGAYEHVVLQWPDAPFRGADRLAKIVTVRRSLGLLTWIEGAPIHYLELDYATALAASGRDRAARLARDFLAGVLGTHAIRNMRVLAVTDWLSDPLSRSSWSVVPPGRVAIRTEAAKPVADRIWFAGEATSRSLWGTVGGAWEEGERAAREVLAIVGRGEPERPGEARRPNSPPAGNDVSASAWRTNAREATSSGA